MLYDLQQKFKETFPSKLTDVSVMDLMKCIANTLASFNLMHHLNRFLSLVIVMLVFVVIILLALKCIMAYLHNTMRQHDREKAIIALWQHNQGN